MNGFSHLKFTRKEETIQKNLQEPSIEDNDIQMQDHDEPPQKRMRSSSGGSTVTKRSSAIDAISSALFQLGHGKISARKGVRSFEKKMTFYAKNGIKYVVTLEPFTKNSK